MRLLVVDDDVELCGLLGEFLQREGFQVQLEHEGRKGLEQAVKGGFDLVILDVMLPGLDGFEILKRLRSESRVPVLMLTARGEDVDRIVGLELGADDYLAKPFNPRELSARIKAILRRTEMKPNRGRVEVNGVVLDPGSRQVMIESKPVELTTLEFDILEHLMRAAGHVVSRDDLMESLVQPQVHPVRPLHRYARQPPAEETGGQPPCDQDDPGRRLSVLPDGRGSGGCMRSLFAKTLLWFLATTAVAITGITVTTALTFKASESRQSPFTMLLQLQVEDARRAYETGGPQALAGAVGPILERHRR